MATDTAVIVAFRAYRDARQHVCLEATVANTGGDEVRYVTLDVWPKDGEPGALTIPKLAGRTLWADNLTLKLGRTVSEVVDVRLSFADARGRLQELHGTLAIDAGEAVVSLCPSAGPLVDAMRQHGVADGEMSGAFTVVPLEPAASDDLDESVSLVDPDDSGLSPEDPLELAEDDESLALGEDGSGFEELDLTIDDDLSLEDSQISLSDDEPIVKEGSTGSAIQLGAGLDDDDLVLGGSGSSGSSGSGSDISIGQDSGISLVDPEDSGLSLEDPLELAEDDESLALGEDDVLSLSEDADTEAPTELKSDDDFLLEPLEELGEEEAESGSQVIALDESIGDEAATLGGAAMLDEESVAFDPGIWPAVGAPTVDGSGLQDRPASPQSQAPPALAKEQHRRWTDVDFPSEVPLGQWEELSVAVILKERVLDDGRVVQVAKPHSHDRELVLERQTGETMAVDVVLSAPGYKIDGNPFTCIWVPHDADSEIVVFRLCAMEAGLKPITLNFYQKKRYVGTVQLDARVVGRGERASQQRAAVKATIDFSGSGTAPDLTLHIAERPLSDGTTELRFTLISTVEGLDLQDGGSVMLRQNPAQWIDQALASIQQLLDEPATRELAERRIASIGYDLYDQLFPPRLKDLFWRFRERLTSVMVVSEEPWIPWEMVRPHSEQVTCGHLCEQYLFSRWLAGRPLPTSLSGNVGRIVAFGEGSQAPRLRDIQVEQRPQQQPPGPGVSQELPWVGRELDMFRGLGRHGLRVDELPPTLRTLLDAFEQGGFDVLHFACHGTYNRTSPDHSMVQLSDGRLCPEDLSGPYLRFAETRPMVFLNACHTGRTGHALTRIGSWASRFIQGGCGAFVGSFWAVEDDLAYEFAERFYRGLFTGLRVGEAFRRARQSIKRPDSTTWMAFCLYADPHATMASVAGGTSVEPGHRPRLVEETFDLALRQRRFRDALDCLSQMTNPLQASLSKNRWRWAVVNEMSAAARKTTIHLNKGRAHGALRTWEELQEVLRAAPDIASEASPALTQMAETVIRAVCNGIRVGDLYQIVVGCAKLPGIESSSQNRLAILRKSLGDVVRTLDRLNEEPPQGMLARRSHRRKVRKVISNLNTKHALPDDWVEKAVLSQIERWPNVLKTLNAEKFTEHEHVYYTNAGLRLLRGGEHRLAAQHFMNAIRLKPNSPAAYNNYAWVFVVSEDSQFSDLEQAVTFARQAVKLSLQPSYLDTLAELERKRGNLDAAIEAMRQAMENDPVEPDRWADKLEKLLAEKGI